MSHTQIKHRNALFLKFCAYQVFRYHAIYPLYSLWLSSESAFHLGHASL